MFCFSKAFNGVTTTSRGCHQNCVNSASTKCCASNNCNKEYDELPFQCYQCSTTGDSDTDACLTGDISSPIMRPFTCEDGERICYKESEGKFIELNLILICINSILIF